jgi:hypothetical protein
VHREPPTPDGLSVVLEFSAKVGDKSPKGIDMIRFDDTGHIVDVEVMVRPLNGLEALGPTWPSGWLRICPPAKV